MEGLYRRELLSVMASTLRTVVKLLIGDTKDSAPAGCTLTANITPKGPGAEAALQQTVAQLGFQPTDCAFTVCFHCTSAEQATTIATGLRQVHAEKKATSAVLQGLESNGIETLFEDRGDTVVVTLKLASTEAAIAMCGMVETMIPEVFSQPSKAGVSVALAKDLRESTESDLQALYSLFEGCRVEVTLELWRNLFHYLRTQLKDTVQSPDMSKLLTLASIYSRGSVELKLRGAHAIPAEIRDKISGYSRILTQLRNFIASEEEPALTAFVKSVASNCLPRAEAVLMTPLGLVAAEVNAPGLSTVFLKE